MACFHSLSVRESTLWNRTYSRSWAARAGVVVRRSTRGDLPWRLDDLGFPGFPWYLDTLCHNHGYTWWRCVYYISLFIYIYIVGFMVCWWYLMVFINVNQQPKMSRYFGTATPIPTIMPMTLQWGRNMIYPFVVARLLHDDIAMITWEFRTHHDSGGKSCVFFGHPGRQKHHHPAYLPSFGGNIRPVWNHPHCLLNIQRQGNEFCKMSLKPLLGIL